MPSSTKNHRPIIVYLPAELYDEVAAQAKNLYRSQSSVCRELIAEALAWRQQGSRPSSGQKGQSRDRT